MSGPHRHLKRWSTEEKALALKLRDEGRTGPQIADTLGRSLKSIKSLFYEPRRHEPKATGTSFYDGPAIARCPTQERYIANAISGSAMLRDAILRLAA
jgi:hypothetical protein